MLRKVKVFLALSSAALLILAFPNFNFEFLAWVGLVPLFFAIDGKKPLQAFLLAYLAGVIFFFGTIYWLIHVTLPGMIVVVLYLALYFGLFGFLFSIYGLRIIGYWLLLFAPAAWVTLEWLRSSGMFGFGWNLLGYSQSFTLPVIQIADITGVYGVSFLVVMVNAAIFLAIKAFKKREGHGKYLAAAALALFACLLYGYFRLNNIFTGEPLTITVVQGNIPQEKKWDSGFRERIIRTYEDLTKKAVKEDVDLVIWPETSVPGFLELENDLYQMVRSLALETHAPLLVGAPREDEKISGAYYNSAYLIADDGRIVAHYDKAHLVPFGEFIPFKSALSFVNKFSTMPIGDFWPGKEYTVFTLALKRENIKDDIRRTFVKNVRFSCLICFEDIFPDLTRKFARQGIDFLVNITNDAWFKKTNAAYQHAQCSVLRAVENRVSVVRAANTGFSCFIDQKGRITAFVEKEGERTFVPGFKTQAITLARTGTFYKAYGDLFAYLCMALSALCLARPLIFMLYYKRFHRTGER